MKYFYFLLHWYLLVKMLCLSWRFW